MVGKWEQVPLEKLLSQTIDTVVIQDDLVYKQVTARLHNKGLVLRQQIAGREIRTKKQFRIRTGQFVYSRIDARNGAMGLVPPNLDGAIVTNDFPVFDVHPGLLDARFLHYYTSTATFLEQCLAASAGTTNRRRLKERNFLSISIPLPPLEEQRRIVARIEALANRSKELQCLQQDVTQRARALITSARIEALEDALLEFGPVPLGQVADIQLGKMLSPKSRTGSMPHPYLRNANVQWDRFDLADVKQMDFDDREVEKYTLQQGDLLVCEGGEIGRAAIWNNEMDGCLYQKALHRVRVREGLLPRFILHCLFWGSSTGRFTDLKTQTTIPHLPVVKLKRFEIPSPPLSEQARIVARLDALQLRVEALLQLQETALLSSNTLLPALLDRAFRGEL